MVSSRSRLNGAAIKAPPMVIDDVTRSGVSRVVSWFHDGAVFARFQRKNGNLTFIEACTRGGE